MTKKVEERSKSRSTSRKGQGQRPKSRRHLQVATLCCPRHHHPSWLLTSFRRWSRQRPQEIQPCQSLSHHLILGKSSTLFRPQLHDNRRRVQKVRGDCQTGVTRRRGSWPIQESLRRKTGPMQLQWRRRKPRQPQGQLPNQSRPPRGIWPQLTRLRVNMAIFLIFLRGLRANVSAGIATQESLASVIVFSPLVRATTVQELLNIRQTFVNKPLVMTLHHLAAHSLMLFQNFQFRHLLFKRRVGRELGPTTVMPPPVNPRQTPPEPGRS